jgi:hypothetical protein
MPKMCAAQVETAKVRTTSWSARPPMPVAAATASLHYLELVIMLASTSPTR